ncbi:MerR family transcriptional regulator [Corynebacterium epidermidicanis]|uniref:Putative transcriptional regulator n=1 Tax=Corynebacterium epidermidicanis TaxID=1050174 RepID=A0A0G3GS39_9CORY|nr:putative transcriptional regulator [Corynebacterium epidermidicanis]
MNEELTIGEAASLLGISTRTLRHWDSIGLLSPSYRTWGDYRLYTESDVDKAWEILVYRETGMSLKDISAIVDGQSSRTERLRAQQRHLQSQLVHLQRMQAAVNLLLEGKLTMTEKAQAFGQQWYDYEQEAKQRWGDTPEWEQAQRKQQHMSKEDFAAVKQEMADFNAALAAAHAEEVAPGSEAARELVLRHRAQIAQWYECTPAKQVCLARMYVADDRFADTYEGLAGYLLQLVEAQAQAEGVDLADVKWG